jgi:hypothetical protein
MNLTKSSYLKFLQCPKALWLYKFRPELKPKETDPALQRRFDEGYYVESFAYQLFPGGVNAEEDDDLAKTISNTTRLLQEKPPAIFQAAVSSGGLFCKSDIIVYNAKSKKWDIYEVKSSTGVKDVHLPDLAFQKLCFEQAGVAIGRTYLVHINNEYVRQGEIAPDQLLTITNITWEVDELLPDTRLNIKDAQKVYALKAEPQARILKQCSSPYECDFIEYCWKDVPPESIYDLAGKLSEENISLLLDQGIIKLKDIPEAMVTSARARRHYQAVKTDQIHIDKQAIKEELSQLKYPLYFLDYETFSPAVPLFDGWRPYQPITFQYSLHVQTAPGAPLVHHSFLAKEWQDPSEALAKELRKVIGKKGSVIVWNMSFEKARNSELGERCPEYEAFFNSLNERIVDLMLVFKKGYYVHRGFEGSASLKCVLPVLVPKLSYEELNISEGGTASESWREMIDPETTKAESNAIYNDLLQYCELDTKAMVEILGKLQAL